MAKRVDHLGVVVKVTGVALTQDLVLVAGLVVAIAHVDAFEIAHVVVAGGVTVLVGELEVAVVLAGGAGQRVGHKGVHGVAGGVHAAAEDTRQRVGAIGAGRRHKDDALDGRVVGHPVQLQGARGVDDEHHVVIVIVEVLQDLELGSVGLEVALGLVLGVVRMVVHGARHVSTLACHAAPHEHGHGALGAVEHAVGGLELGERALVNGKVLRRTKADGAGAHGVGRAGTLGIELHERVVDVQALGLEGGCELVLVARGAQELRHEGLGGREVLDVLGEEAERGALGKRHRGVVVLEQHVALGGDLGVERLLGVGDLVGGKVALVVLGVNVLGAVGGGPALLVAQHVVGHAHDHALAGHDDVHGHHDRRKHEHQHGLEDGLHHPSHLAGCRNLLGHRSLPSLLAAPGDSNLRHTIRRHRTACRTPSKSGRKLTESDGFSCHNR